MLKLFRKKKKETKTEESTITRPGDPDTISPVVPFYVAAALTSDSRNESTSDSSSYDSYDSSSYSGTDGGSF